jgi:hypothetical protein
VTDVSPLEERELAEMAQSVMENLVKQFGRQRVRDFLDRDRLLTAAFSREVFLAIRIKIHGK